MISTAPITADEIAHVHTAKCGLGIIEFHNGAMCIADIDDLEEFGEANRTTNTVKFPSDMSREVRIAKMIANFLA